MYYDPSGKYFIKITGVLSSIFSLEIASTISRIRDIHYSRIEKGKEFQFKENYYLYTKEELESEYITNVSANCHQFSASNYDDHIKIMTKDGHYEAIYNKKTGVIVTDPRDIGTYNYAHPNNDPIGHAILDVVPWIIFGNSEQDTSNIFQRVGYMIYGLFV